MHKSCTPPRNRITHIMLGQPPTGSPKASVLTSTTAIKINATMHSSTPSTLASASGAVENATMPSSEYRNSFQNDHLVSPATRSTLTNGTHLVLKPTQPKMPLEKRLYSRMDRIASTITRRIKR